MTRSRRSRPGADRWADIKGGMAFVIPVQLIKHENYRRLSPWAHKLIADLSTQYGGYNNGYLCAAWTAMQPRGWKYRTTLDKAAAELEHFGFIERTQQGGRNKPNLYAFSWRRIDKIDGRKLDSAPTMVPSNAWERTAKPFVYRPRVNSACPSGGPTDELQAHDLGDVCPFDGQGIED